MFKQMKVALDEGAYMPVRAHDLDAGLDLFTPVKLRVPRHGYAFVNTGVHVELPYGTRGHVCSKSGLNKNHGLTADGTVDEGYVGPIGVTVHNSGPEDYWFKPGDKVAQLVIEAILRPGMVKVDVDELKSGERGSRGFGSTGR